MAGGRPAHVHTDPFRRDLGAASDDNYLLRSGVSVALMLTVDPGHSVEYIAELCLMTPYRYLVTLESESHYTHILRVDMASPDLLVREVNHPGIRGVFRSLNEVYPIGARKPNSRYMGEILRVSKLHDVAELQKAREFRFFSQDEVRRLELPGNLAVSKPSPHTRHVVAYPERPAESIRVYALGVSSIRSDVQDVYLAAKALQETLRVHDLMLLEMQTEASQVVTAADIRH